MLFICLPVSILELLFALTAAGNLGSAAGTELLKFWDWPRRIEETAAGVL